MPDTLTDLQDLQTLAANLSPKRIIIPGCDRIEDLRVVRSLLQLPFVATCICVGDGEKIAASAAAAEVDVAQIRIVATADEAESAARTVELVKAKEADIIMKGNISTPTLNRAILQLKSRDTISLVTLFQSPFISGGRPMILTDAGVTTVCNYSRLTALIRNAAEVARYGMGIDNPKVAFLSANEKQVASMPSTGMGKALADAHWDGMTVYGPLSFDLATDPESVRLKGIDTKYAGQPITEVAGKADVLICPSIDAANILYKTLMSLVGHGQALMAGITMGVEAPYIILSRADNEETKINSVALCCIFADAKAKAEPGSAEETQVKNDYTVLAVNPGSTSVKLGLYNGDEEIAEYEAPHGADVTLRGAAFDAAVEEYLGIIQKFLADNGSPKLDAVVGRGGFVNRNLGRIQGGTYAVADVKDGEVVVDEQLVHSVRDIPELNHASNYGIPVAARIAVELGIPAYMLDSVVADEFEPVARISGLEGIDRKSTSHFLSLKAMARKAAKSVGRPFDQCSFVVSHMGGGITVGACRNGRIIDNTIALLGEGPFTPQRAGTLPLRDIVDLACSGKYTRDELFVQLTKKGGLLSYLEEDDLRTIQARIEDGDDKAKTVLEAMAYQVSKNIGAMFVVAGKQTEALVFSGGLTKSKLFMGMLKEHVGHLAPMLVFSENLEMTAMAGGALRALRGEEMPRQFVAESSARGASTV